MKAAERMVMAHRYLYYVLHKPVISDYQYDMMEKDAIKKAHPDSQILKPGSDKASDYSEATIKLAQDLSKL